MANINVKFNASSVKGKQGYLHFQIFHRGTICRIKTAYRIYPEEWDSKNECISIRPDSDDCGHFFRKDSDLTGRTERKERFSHLQLVEEGLKLDKNRLLRLISQIDRSRTRYTPEVLRKAFLEVPNPDFLFGFMRQLMDTFEQLGRLSTVESYESALRSFRYFRQGEDLPLVEIDAEQMEMYEAYLYGRGVVRNTSSFYMRILRAVYNRAVEKGLTEQKYPFKHVYTGIDKTVKRAISLDEVKMLRGLDLSKKPKLMLARDMFLFSFYTRGMSFVDMAYLRKCDLQGGILRYKRRKTGQRLTIKWEHCMQELLDKYDSVPEDPFLLPIFGFPYDGNRKQYKSKLLAINRDLKEIGRMVGMDVRLTMYVARHSWATAARNKNIPISVISQGMGHDSEMTTRIYLASLENRVVDEANNLILEGF